MYLYHKASFLFTSGGNIHIYTFLHGLELTEADRGILGVNPLTPEPSPVRDLADEPRFSPSRSVARRISFTEDPAPDQSVNMEF